MSESIVQQLDPIFKPRSVALVGASNNRFKWGGMVLNRILASEFRGTVYPVNPKESEIAGIKAYADVLDIPDPVDLAVFTIPAAQMPKIMKNCVEKGIRGGVIISADFAETGEKGEALHVIIPFYLGNDRCGGDGQGAVVTLDHRDAGNREVEGYRPVNQYAVGGYRDFVQETLHEQLHGPGNGKPVNLPGRGEENPGIAGMFPDQGRGLFPFPGGEFF